ncbi:MAG TPA: hypothetical protein VLT79_01710 [Gemmatimonadales bacterium]|nr:hypothetical protein [Gemmatimonadales bacterium]
MNNRLSLMLGLSLTALLPMCGAAQAAPSDADYIKLATSAAPASLAAAAAVVRVDPAAKQMKQLRAGTNGITCSVIPDGSNAPFCGDQNAWTWFTSMGSGLAKPANTAPGVGYMAAGGMHYETPSGDIVMDKAANTKEVKEPPHWMLMWPVDPAASGLPTRPNPAGVYVMFAGTPWAHLMIYQDPGKLESK